MYPDLFPHRNEDGSGTDGDASRDDDASSVLLPDQDDFPIDGLDPEIANNMIENCIGCLGMPLGLAVNFIINGVPLGVPMVTEEPSVIAAVSGAAKTMSNFGCMLTKEQRCGKLGSSRTALVRICQLQEVLLQMGREGTSFSPKSNSLTSRIRAWMPLLQRCLLRYPVIDSPLTAILWVVCSWSQSASTSWLWPTSTVKAW